MRFFDAEFGYENLWAEKRDVDIYVIKSIPYFIYDISVEDVIRVTKDEAGQTLYFSELVTHSEHSTIRVRAKDFTLDQREGEELLRKIESFEAVTETLPARLVAVDIPSCGGVEPLARFLSESHIHWEWADKAAC